MQFLEDILIEPLRVMKAYLLGRGLLSSLTMATWFVAKQFGASTILPASIAAGGGLAFAGFMQLTRRHVYEDQMVTMYRDDIAQHLGIAPEQVTRGHLKQAAQENDVIDQALKRKDRSSFISLATSALAAGVTVGLIALGAPEIIAGMFGAGALGTIMGYASFAIVSTLSSLVVHDGLEAIIKHQTGINLPSAHDRIVNMERTLTRGYGVSKEQVYSVLVAGNPDLQASIKHQFGKSYAGMMANEKSQVLLGIGVDNDMQRIADSINRGELRPSSLAYMLNDAMPRPERKHTAPVSQAPQRSHVAALGRPVREEAPSHVARLDAERAMAALSEPVR